MPASKLRRLAARKKYNSVRSEVLYFLAPRRANFVNSIVNIMEDDDGPRPMRNMKPAQKQRTAADKFQSDHHGEYEARGRQSRDKVNRVYGHNNAYPKMCDELDNRRSTAKPSMRRERSASNEGKRKPLCKRCLRKMTNRDKKSTRKYSKTPNRRMRSYKTKSRITKPKQRLTRKNQHRSKNLKSKFNISKACQYYRVSLETKSISTYDDDSGNSITKPGTSKRQESSHNMQDVDEEKLKREDSAISIPDAATKSEHSGNPGTSPPSISSCNSYLSMGHEPMVD